MQQHIGRAGMIRAGEIADTAAIGHRALENIGFKPLIEIMTNRFCHQLSQMAAVFGVKLGQDTAGAENLANLTEQGRAEIDRR